MRTIVVYEVTTIRNDCFWEWSLLAADGVGTERVHYTEPGPGGRQVTTATDAIMARRFEFTFQVRESVVG